MIYAALLHPADVLEWADSKYGAIVTATERLEHDRIAATILFTDTRHRLRYQTPIWNAGDLVRLSRAWDE